MDIQKEKTYIYEMMKEITQERRRLTDIYYGLKERLDFLFQQEQKGLETLSLKGYTDLFNQIQKEIAVTNIQREANHVIKQMETPLEENKSIIPKQEIEKEKDIVYKKEKRTGLLNIDKATNLIAIALKDVGSPITLQNLYERVNALSEIEITKKNFQNNIIRRAMIKNNKIENPTKGFYQYRV